MAPKQGKVFHLLSLYSTYWHLSDKKLPSRRSEVPVTQQ